MRIREHAVSAFVLSGAIFAIIYVSQVAAGNSGGEAQLAKPGSGGIGQTFPSPCAILIELVGTHVDSQQQELHRRRMQQRQISCGIVRVPACEGGEGNEPRTS
jgi:hypothetical protein